MAVNTRMISRIINVGSPSTQFAFEQKVNTIVVDNLTSTGVYFNTGAGPNTGSITIGSSVYVGGGNAIEVDCLTGSVTFCASGLYASGLQLIGLG